MTARALSMYEHELLQRLVAANREGIVGQVDLAKLEAEVIDEFGSLKFKRQSTAEARQTKLPAEATLTDKDGVNVHALLFACAGELDELQIYKDDGSPLCAVPRPEAWKIDVL
jgi:hypothetical protein